MSQRELAKRLEVSRWDHPAGGRVGVRWELLASLKSRAWYRSATHYSDTVARFPGAIDTILRIVELVFGLSDNLCHQVDLRVNYTPELRGKYPESSQSILVGSL